MIASPSALSAEAVSLGRASGFAMRLSSSSIGEVEERILCGRRGVPTVSYQKLVGAGAESCPRKVDVPDFQGFGILNDEGGKSGRQARAAVGVCVCKHAS